MFSSIKEILKDLRQGKMIIVVDDEGRENEGDIVCAGEFITAEKINFMAKFARGLTCVPMESKRLDELGLYPMKGNVAQAHQSCPRNTGWAVSVDAAKGITTGISAADRAQTVKVLVDDETKVVDLITPGHMFPLRAVEGGVLVRAGHTEATTDLMRLAGLKPVGVICEIMNDDGTMARTDNLKAFSKKHDLKICTVDSLIEHLRATKKLIEKQTIAKMPTKFGEFVMHNYKSLIDDKDHLALTMGDIAGDEAVLVRVQSECLTGDVFGSLRCDCNAQLHTSLRAIKEAGKGVLLYMRQEGRGIGLDNKLKAYNLQDQGMDTVEANEALGFAADLRHYGIGAQILSDLGVKKIKLLTNNPRKVVGLDGYGLSIAERVSIQIQHNPINEKYLQTKKNKLGHYLD